MSVFQFPKRLFSARAMMLGGVLSATLLQPLNAAPLALEFRPPEGVPSSVCKPRGNDTDIVARWQDWDGASLGGLSSAQVKRDIKRLQQLDARAWLPTIEQLIETLSQADPSYAGRNALLSRIEALQAAGQFERIRDLQLVPHLAQDIEEASPRMQNALSRFYREGIGVDRDIDRANELLINAGYGGNADALLALSKYDLDGSPVPNWDVPSDLAITMAFGALVGELNETICDRTARIAREYHNGEVVAQDSQMAHDWFRFTADLGDPNAAWKVVEYHMRAEELDKDNPTLLKYLTMASDAGLPFAQIELGRLYESGSIVEKDLTKALDLFRGAASTGLRPGLTRLGLFLEQYGDHFPDVEAEKREAFAQLAVLPEAPSWVFNRLAQQAQAEKGRWEALPDSIKYYEISNSLGDMEGKNRLALSLMARGEKGDFERAVNLLSQVVSIHGGVTPSKQLFAAFMCQAADSPRVEEAMYWSEIEAATDTANVDLRAEGLRSLMHTRDPKTFAALQSQALYGRPSSLATWLKFLELSKHGGQPMADFWEGYSEQFNFVLEALAKLELELAIDPEDRLAAFDLMRREFKKSGANSAVSLASALLEIASDNDRAEIVTIMQEAAENGVGDAMQILASVQGTEDAAQQVFEQYVDVISANGDFDALVFALPYVAEDMKLSYFTRAVGLARCDYQNAMALAQVARKVGLIEKSNQWVDIATELTRENAWAQVDLGQTKMEFYGAPAETEAAQLFAAAATSGDFLANLELFELKIDVASDVFDPSGAAGMIETASQSDNIKLLSAFLGRYRRAEEPLKTEVQAILDMPNIYRIAAESGDIYSMRNYGMHLRDSAPDAATLALSTEWLGKAAEGGDVTAMAEYGQALAFGWGAEADLPTAIKWLSQAEERGSKNAKQIMSLVRLSKPGDV